MRRNTLALAVLVGLLALAGALPARDQKDDKDKLAGTWARKAGELTIAFADKNVMKISPHGDKVAFIIVCKYTIDKDGLVKAKISELEGKEEILEKAKALLPVGLEFSFKWKVKGDAATIDDLKGDKVDTLKSHVEGDYEKK